MEYLQYLKRKILNFYLIEVLNLVINGIPSIPWKYDNYESEGDKVLNLVINGIPSILEVYLMKRNEVQSFKPCYKWNTFNT